MPEDSSSDYGFLSGAYLLSKVVSGWDFPFPKWIIFSTASYSIYFWGCGEFGPEPDFRGFETVLADFEPCLVAAGFDLKLADFSLTADPSKLTILEFVLSYRQKLGEHVTVGLIGFNNSMRFYEVLLKFVGSIVVLGFSFYCNFVPTGEFG